ncbi:MAG TPA: ABC transporter permease [Chitinophagaceae bacterium]|nr:ABC transporter permease [Chitinophagaceae bacterium]
MLRNYLLTAYRNLLRNKSYTAINVIGLAVGIAACLLIFLVIWFQTSFDNFHKKRDAIYRVVSEFNNPDGKGYSSGVPLPVAAGLRLDYPQVKEVASIYGGQSGLVSIPEEKNDVYLKKFNEDRGVYFAEPQFFQMFDFKWLAGNSATALKEPNTGILTKETAERYFGNWEAAVGKTIRHNNRNLIKITGILDNVPVNSDFPLKVVISFKTLKNTGAAANLDDWVSTSSDANCFIELPSSLPASTFNTYLKSFVKKHKPAEYVKDNLILQPFKDLHFDDRFGNFKGSTFSKELLTALSLIGIFLLVIACVNFINLATAQAVNRAKEVGVRKVLGSNRSQLIGQFIGETALITFTAILVALGIAAMTLPFLNQLLQVPLHLSFDGSLFLFLLAVLLLVTMISGFYPAVVLSGFNPSTALKSKIAPKIIGGISLRRGLVVLQFCIAQVLIIGTLVIVNQMSFFRNANLGFDKEAIVAVPLPGDSISTTKYDYLRDQLANQPGIKQISFSFATPANDGSWYSDFKFDHATKSTDFGANLKWADTSYFNLYNLQFVAGRPYMQSDTVREFVVNETLVKKLGLRKPQDIIGKELNFWDGSRVATVVGVIKDFHANSLRDPIVPVVMGCWKDVYQTMGIKIIPERATETLATIEKLWNQAFPENVYEYQFLDDRIANFYQQENQLSRLYKMFAGIAIFISCLGLYGLVSFMAVQRNKEVGIRKVLGASVSSIVYLFSKEFTILIAIAFLIAAPVAYYFMHNWLANFTYRINLDWTIFLLGILVSVLIAWITVGYKAIKAAMANPVNSLRTE